MSYRRRWGGPALLLLALVVALAPVDAASARARKASSPPRPKPGWLVERVRIEPIDPSGVVGVAGVGQYRGALELRPSPNGGVAVVNDIDFEEYVKGLAEVPSSWPTEALKAQAIAARTYALAELSVGADVATAARGVGAQICATDACQVYAGVAKERNADAASTFPNWVAAVSETAGEVVLYENAPIVAKYSSSNGGRSVYGGRPYLKPVDDPDDRHSPLHRWRSQLPNTSVAAALGLEQGLILRLQRSGDTVFVDWQGPDGAASRLTIAATDFRSRVNAMVGPPPGLPKAVPSMRYTPSADPSSNTVVVDGGGWGHFIGMSQWGAYGKALRGMKASDILAAYYGGLRPTRLDESRLPKTIRVAVDFGRPVADIAAHGRFRVLDQAGRPIAVATSGAWRVVPEGSGVRVLPAPGQDAVPVVQPLAVDPIAPTTTAPVTVRYHLTTPAVVGLTITDESGAPAGNVEPRLVDAGDLASALPAPARPGRYVVTIVADAGGGRLTSVPVPVEVHATPPATIGPATAPPAASVGAVAGAVTAGAGADPLAPGDRNAAAALAATLLAAVGSATLRRARATRIQTFP